MKKSLRNILCAGAVVLAAGAAFAQNAQAAGGYAQTNLVTDGGAGGGTKVPAKFTDPRMLNPWGISFLPGGVFWISDNGTNMATLYDGQGHVLMPGASGGFTIPGGAPTGQVSNTDSSASFGTFKIPNAPGTAGKSPALFIFSGEDGIISAWQPGDGKQAVKLVDNSGKKDVYKGIAMASSASGLFLYVTDFRHGVIEVYDDTFTFVTKFTDPNLPAGYAPFGIANIDGELFVTLAKQDAKKHDDVQGPGHGFVDVFDTRGNLVRRFTSRGPLNSPWAIVRAPADFGAAGSDVLIGNFGDGRINAFSSDGKFVTTLTRPSGTPIAISGLWGLTFPTSVWGGVAGADPTTLYFTGGTDHERGGLFGTIAPAH